MSILRLGPLVQERHQRAALLREAYTSFGVKCIVAPHVAQQCRVAGDDPESPRRTAVS